MDNNIYNIEEYKKLLELQQKYEQDLIDEDEMTLDEINELIKLYTHQIKKKKEVIKNKLLQKSKDWYK